MLVGLLLPAVQSAREAARRLKCQANLRQLGIGLQNYLTACGVFPFGVGADADGSSPSIASARNRRYSLHSQLLPYIEQAALFNQINFWVQPFDPDTTGDPTAPTGDGAERDGGAGPRSRCSSARPTSTGCRPGPGGRRTTARATARSWSGRAGDGMFGQSTRIGPAHVRDGLSNTAAMCERIRGHDDFQRLRSRRATCSATPPPGPRSRSGAGAPGLSDAEAADVPEASVGRQLGHELAGGEHGLDPLQPPAAAGAKSCANGLTWNGVAMTANSRHAEVVGLLLGDGSVRPVKYSVDPAVWKALGTIAGGEAIAGDSY